MFAHFMNIYGMDQDLAEQCRACFGGRGAGQLYLCVCVYIYKMYAYIKSITVDLLYVALRLAVPLFPRRDSDDPYMSMILWIDTKLHKYVVARQIDTQIDRHVNG